MCCSGLYVDDQAHTKLVPYVQQLLAHAVASPTWDVPEHDGHGRMCAAIAVAGLCVRSATSGPSVGQQAERVAALLHKQWDGLNGDDVFNVLASACQIAGYLACSNTAVDVAVQEHSIDGLLATAERHIPPLSQCASFELFRFVKTAVGTQLLADPCRVQRLLGVLTEQHRTAPVFGVRLILCCLQRVFIVSCEFCCAGEVPACIEPLVACIRQLQQHDPKLCLLLARLAFRGFTFCKALQGTLGCPATYCIHNCCAADSTAAGWL